MNPRRHPSGSTLELFVAGTLTEERDAEIKDHVHGCRTCAVTVAALHEAYTELVDDARHLLGGDASVPTSPTLGGASAPLREPGPALAFPTRKPVSANVTWQRLAVAASIAATVGGAFYLLRSSRTDQGEVANAASPTIDLAWTGRPTISLANRSHRPFSAAGAFPSARPDYSAGTLGAAPRAAHPAALIFRQRRATPIVRAGERFGNGAFVTRDGWLVLPYDLIAAVAQTAAVAGNAAEIGVIVASDEDGQLQPSQEVPATVYRADPASGLALARVPRVTSDFFAIGGAVRVNDAVALFGSSAEGAWSARDDSVERLIPADTGRDMFVRRPRIDTFATSNVATPDDHLGEVVADPTRLMLLGMTLSAISTPPSTPGGQTRAEPLVHAAASAVGSLLAELPTTPDVLPFDLWTAGLVDAQMLDPQRVDGDNQAAAVAYTYVQLPPGAGDSRNGALTEARVLARALYVDLKGAPAAVGGEALVPAGLWAVPGGSFRFDVVLVWRNDGLVAAGFTNEAGEVDEIRVTQRAQAGLRLWRRKAGRWTTATELTARSPLDSPRLAAEANLRLARLVAAWQKLSN